MIRVPSCLFVAILARAASDQPVPRTDQNSLIAHTQLLEKAKQGGIDIYFEGDSITRRWGATDYPQLLANWKQNFFGWNAADFGWGADKIEHILWRLDNGELDGVNPKIIVLLAGTNNVGAGATAEDVTRGLKAIVRTMQTKAPAAVIIVTGIFPRNDRPDLLDVIAWVNVNLLNWADGKRVRFLSVTRQARGSGWQSVRRDDEPRQAASRAGWISGVGGWAEADFYGIAGSAEEGRPRSGGYGRS